MENKSSNKSNSKEGQPPNDPLRQLNQFYQSFPPNKQKPADDRQSSPKGKKKEEQPNRFQNLLEYLETGWSNLLGSSMVKNLKQNPKWLWIIGGSIITCVIFFVLIINLTRSPDVIEEFERAMIEEDQKTLKKLLVSEHSELEIDEAFLTRLIDHGKEDDNFLTDTLNLMRAQQRMYEEELTEVARIKETPDSGVINLKQNEGFFGGDYVIAVKPVYIKIRTSNQPTKLTLDGKSVKLKNGANEQLLGPILPGKYKLVATKKYPYSEVIDEQEVNLFKKARTATVLFELEGETVRFISDIEGTELFVNNRPTGKKVGMNGEDFGPVSTDGKLKAHGQVQFPWGSLKSDPTPIDQNEIINITPRPASDPKLRDEIIKIINQYSKEVIEVQKQRDGNRFTTLDDEQKQKWVNDMIYEKQYTKSSYEGEPIKTIIAFDQATLSEGENANVYRIKVPVQYHRREKEYGMFDTGTEPLEEEIVDSYTWLTYNNETKKWEISRFDSFIFSNGDLFKDSNVITTNFK